MRSKIIMLLCGLGLLVVDATAQIDPPHISNLVWELQQDPIFEPGMRVALADVHFSLIGGEPCNPVGYNELITEIIFDFCDVIGVPDINGESQVDAALYYPLLNELANEVDVEPFPFRGEEDR